MKFDPGIRHRSEIPLTDARLKRAVAAGELIRVCRGWYAHHGADQDSIAARKAGGTITAQTLLAKYGVWLMRDHRVHVRVPPNWPTKPAPPMCAHWFVQPTSPRDELRSAILAMAVCSQLTDLVVAIDSVLDKRLLRIDEIRALNGQNSRLDTAIKRMSWGSQAGGETLVRLLLIRYRIRFTVQAQIGSARVDLLVGDRFVIEVDGREFHLGEQFERDRARDRELIQAGYLVMRISYRMLMTDWDATAQAILAVVRRGDHRWPRTAH